MRQTAFQRWVQVLVPLLVLIAVLFVFVIVGNAVL